MKYLLDTQIWLWWLRNDARIGDDLGALLTAPGSTVFLSAASIWEVAIKFHNGKLPVVRDPETFLEDCIESSGAIVLDIKSEHALKAGSLPLHHKDQFDRMLVAQAKVEGLTLVTSDLSIPDYEVSLLRVDG